MDTAETYIKLPTSSLSALPALGHSFDVILLLVCPKLGGMLDGDCSLATNRYFYCSSPSSLLPPPFFLLPPSFFLPSPPLSTTSSGSGGLCRRPP